MEPEFPDGMVFELVREDDDSDRTFSRDAIDDITDQIHAFIMARLYAHWKSTGKPARTMRVGVDMQAIESTFTTPVDELPLPYYTRRDEGGLTVAVGSRRIPWMPVDKR